MLHKAMLALLSFCLACQSAAAQIPAGQTSKGMSNSAPTQQPSTPDTANLVQKASRDIDFADHRLSGSGGDFLLAEVAHAQFVLIGESHYDHDTPVFADALYHALHEKFGFHHLVVEQDFVGMEDALKPGVRGDVRALAAIARRYPYLIGFASDQDLQLLADVARLEHVPDPIWGLEQAQGTARYLEELAQIASSAELRSECESLLDAARKIEGTRGPHGSYLSDDRDALEKMTALRAHFHAAPGSRASRLLDGLVKSAEIYSYYRRAERGEFVGLFNNMLREAWYSLAVVPLGSYSRWSDMPAWLLPLLPPAPPSRPVLIDLRVLRPYQKLFRAKVAEKDQWQMRAFINGYDAVILLPQSRKADMVLTGFANPF